MAAGMTNMLGTLSHRPRRRLLVKLFLANPRDDTPFDEDEPEPEPAPGDEKLEVLLDFQYYHLPELEEKGFVEYDRDGAVVTRGPNFGEIEPLVTLIEEHRDELPDDWL